MPGKRFKAEEIVNKLRQADVELARGSTVAAVCKLLGITDATYFRWRKEYGGMKVDSFASGERGPDRNSHQIAMFR